MNIILKSYKYPYNLILQITYMIINIEIILNAHTLKYLTILYLSIVYLFVL